MPPDATPARRHTARWPRTQRVSRMKARTTSPPPDLRIQGLKGLFELRAEQDSQCLESRQGLVHSAVSTGAVDNGCKRSEWASLRRSTAAIKSPDREPSSAPESTVKGTTAGWPGGLPARWRPTRLLGPGAGIFEECRNNSRANAAKKGDSVWCGCAAPSSAFKNPLLEGVDAPHHHKGGQRAAGHLDCSSKPLARYLMPDRDTVPTSCQPGRSRRPAEGNGRRGKTTPGNSED